MIFDVNTYIGHWPFRKIRHNTAKSLAEYLKTGGVGKACTSSINAIFYKDCMEANRELMDEIAPYSDFFLPFGIINPVYTGWKVDFIECIEQLGVQGLELYPYYHGYNLTDDSAMELIEMAVSYSIPVHLPCAVVNIRQRHWMDTMKNLDIDELKSVLSSFSDGNFIISNGNSGQIAKQLETVAGKRSGKILYDFARVEVFNGGLDELIKTAGQDNIICGTVSPFQYIEPQRVKLDYADFSVEVYEKITFRNLESIFEQGLSNH